jgi:hypothetical protein
MGIRDRVADYSRRAASVLLEFADGVSFAKADDEPEVGTEWDNELAARGAEPQAPTEKAETDPKAMLWDPFAIVEAVGYKERPSALNYQTLSTMVWRVPVLQAVIGTRVNQVASFAQPQRDRFMTGFRVKLRDSEARPKGADKKFAKDMEGILMRTGVTANPRGRDDFASFLRKVVWDSMVYDAMTFEIVPNRKGQPAEWYAVDATTIRLADTPKLFYDEDDEKEIRTVQIYDSMVIAEYTAREMAFCVRNPRTNIRQHGYGTPELESLIKAVTSLLYAWEYNQKFFVQGSTQKGILNFKGAIPEKQLRAFRRQWYQMVSGVENAWRTPIVNSEDVQWVSMHTNNRDMEYSAWVDFLIKITCAVFLMDPIEVNFKYGNTGSQRAMFEAANKQKLTESKDRGLKPLLRFVARAINKYILWPIDENFEFVFMGLDAQTPEELAKLNQMRVKTIYMVDELRAENDLPPLPDGKGQVILDPTWMQYQQAAMMQGQQGGPGAPGPQGAAQGGDGAPSPAETDPNESTGDDADFWSLFSADEDKPAQPAQPAPVQKSDAIIFDFTI